MDDLEVRQLRYFVAVAEELHYGRAAERLGMAQSPLSRAIRDLERQLGVQLLERTTRQVSLTPAGEALLHDGRSVLEAVNAATRRARHAGAPRPVLRVALKADYDAGLLPRILATYRAGEHVLPVELILRGRGEQIPALREGRADVAMVPVPFDNRGLDVESLVSEPRVVALAATDPLTARDVLRLSDLAGRLLPDGTPAERGGLQRPKSPRHDGPRLDLAEIFNLVETGKVVYFPPVSTADRYRRPDVAYRPVTDLLPFTLAVVWPQDSRSRAVAAFVRAATAVAAKTDPAAGLFDPEAPPSRTPAAP